MTVRALDNAEWGFATSCFVCEPSNPAGLRVPYEVDDELGLVQADVTLGPEYSGAPRFVHGGIVLALLDEAMAWAAIAVAGRFAVVADTRTRFEHGMRVGEPHHVAARIERDGGRTIDASAEVRDASGRRCAHAQAKLVVLSESAAAAAIGAVEGDDRRFLRGSGEQ